MKITKGQFTLLSRRKAVADQHAAIAQTSQDALKDTIASVLMDDNFDPKIIVTGYELKEEKGEYFFTPHFEPKSLLPDNPAISSAP